MAESVTPSAMTDGQIEKAVEVFRAALRKQQSGLQEDHVQLALGVSGLGSSLAAIFKYRVKAFGGMIMRRVTVNRRRTAREAVDATGRNQYVGTYLVNTIRTNSSKDSEEVDVFFFLLNEDAQAKRLEEEYRIRGLVPDPIAVAAVNEAEPNFADNYPNASYWWGQQGQLCTIFFPAGNGLLPGREVRCHNNPAMYNGNYWFGGIRKT